MIRKFKECKIKTKALIRDNIKVKASYLRQVRLFGYKYTDQHLEEMFSKNFERRIKENRLNGMNLTHMKRELELNIGFLDGQLAEAKDSKAREEIKV
jgi:ribosome biogenesis GTPase A